jgi:hypothetical protein
MRGFFLKLAAGLLVVGVVAPALWIAAVVALVLAVLASPAPKPRTGSPAIKGPTRGCPHCASIISRKARVCPYCRMEVGPPPARIGRLWGMD